MIMEQRMPNIFDFYSDYDNLKSIEVEIPENSILNNWQEKGELKQNLEEALTNLATIQQIIKNGRKNKRVESEPALLYAALKTIPFLINQEITDNPLPQPLKALLDKTEKAYAYWLGSRIKGMLSNISSIEPLSEQAKHLRQIQQALQDPDPHTRLSLQKTAQMIQPMPQSNNNDSVSLEALLKNSMYKRSEAESTTVIPEQTNNTLRKK